MKILKDISLITSKINTKKIQFPGKVKISAPTAAMDTSVELITTPEQLQSLSTSQETYTIVKIMGKPSVSNKPEGEVDGRPTYLLNDEDDE